MIAETLNPEILDRVPPHDADAERATLGCVILDASKTDDLGFLRPDDFYLDCNRRVFAQVVAMHDAGQKVDPLLLARRLKAAGDFEAVGGATYLAELTATVPYAHHAKHYGRIVSGHAKRRAIIATATEMIRDGYGASDEPDAILARAEVALAAIETGQYVDEPIPAAKAAEEFSIMVDEIVNHQRQAGLLTGLPTFDEQFGGLFPGELAILAARPGVGKTALACQIAHHVAGRGRPVYFASLEMSAVELTGRIACSVSGVSSKRVRTGKLTQEEVGRLADAAQEISGTTLTIHHRPGMSVADVRRAARRMNRKGLSLVVVDYLQRLSPADARIPRYQQVGQMTDGLKQLASELRVPVLCLCQLNRESEKEDRPRLGHLRESGSIEQDADVVLILHRKTNGSSEGDDSSRQAELLIEKNRNGETGALRMTWIPEATRYDCGWRQAARAMSNYEPAFEGAEQ